MDKINVNHYKAIVVIILSLFGLFLLLYFFYVLKLNPNLEGENIKVTNVVSDKRVNAYREILFSDDPKSLQDSFVDDVKNGINDMYTKSSIYFITHRFFDNSGNIYEIYDYVEAHPELAFLKEAESIYPGIFKSIKNKTLPTVATDAGYYAYLAYVEILVKHGYTDVAAIGTAANQYAKLAYVTTEIAKEMPKNEGQERAKYAKRNIGKASQFLTLVYGDINKILEGKLTSEDIPSQDILVGLNQSAAALRYLEALGFDMTSTEVKAFLVAKGINPSSVRTSKEIFAFSTEYAHRHVPELVLFTSLLNASTLAILSYSSQEEIKNALYPILDFDTKDAKNANFVKVGILPKILDSRFEKKPENIGDTAMDIYSKRNTLRLAKRVPEFKKWLIYNGWTEADFK